jgi:hypothetical protein
MSYIGRGGRDVHEPVRTDSPYNKKTSKTCKSNQLGWTSTDQIDGIPLLDLHFYPGDSSSRFL